MFKKLCSLATLFVVLSLLLAACQQPPPATQVVTQEVQVTTEVEVTTEAGAEATPIPEPEPSAAVYERGQTLYTSGTQWGPPSSWNPFNTGGYAMGTVGLVYETLFLFDPLADEYIPWLAEGGEWTGDLEYTLTLREGITFSDGSSLTAKDVKGTFELGLEAPVNVSTIWEVGLESIEAVDDTTVVFTFSEPVYQQWGNALYGTPILPVAIWGEKSVEEITSGANENPIGTGPYAYEAHDQSRMIWKKREGWWATDALGLDPQPTYIIDIVNGSNNVALGMVLQGDLDLSNNFLPGVASLVEGGYGVQTYYPEPPYMLSANTAWLLLNLTKPPMDDVNFRRAVAYSINVQQIVEQDYGNIVEAANPTGLLPIWDQYVDQDVVDELGFTYNPDTARQILADAGYVDTDGDGFVEAPDGSAFTLRVNNPNGWTDWMVANEIIVAGLREVGINAESNFPDYGGYIDERNQGTFDMMIANDAQMSNTPWTYYNWMFMWDVENVATLQAGNYGRYDNQEAFDLVEQLDATPVDDPEAMNEVISQLQRIQLQDMPLIPMWYNGAWAQYSDNVWTNWPSVAEEDNDYLPVTWRGYWNMTGILMLCDLESVPAE